MRRQQLGETRRLFRRKSDAPGAPYHRRAASQHTRAGRFGIACIAFRQTIDLIQHKQLWRGFGADLAQHRP